MDKYTVIGIVGEGTFGMVARCLDETTGQLVAVKKLRNPVHRASRYLDMIVREVSLLRKFIHDHVVCMNDAFRFCGYVYLVFPLMQYNLYKYIELKGSALTVNHTKECMYQVLKGLSYIHSHNVIHRDIKPENVLLSTDGIIKICDFGVSRMFCANDSLEMSTQIGTVWYQAPEILMGLKNYDSMVDIWSIGILFTELISQYPLVTEHDCIGQLYGIFNILCCTDIELVPINKYLQDYGISLNIETNQQDILSYKSYTVSNTALALRKIYAQWPTYLLEIVSHCLQLNPANRKSANQLLDMKFFTVGTFISIFDKKLKLKLKHKS